MKNHETELIENEELCDLYRKKAEELVSQMTIEELADQTLNSAPPIERLNIKGYDWWNEGLHGVARAGTATVFPQAIGLAAAFDEDLMEQVADAVSTEGRAKFNMQQIRRCRALQGIDLLGAQYQYFPGPKVGTWS